MAELSPSDRAGEFKLGFAGDTFNTAWYLARIAPDLHVSYLTAVGTDAISNDMRAFIRASGIEDTHIRQIAGQTVGLYMIQLDKGERSFCYWRGQSAARQLAQDPAALARAIQDAELVYFSGITLAILDAPAREVLFEALRTARADGRIIAFDTNLRPALWPSAAQMTQTVMRAAGLADIVLPSFDDEAQWFGDADAQATLHRYRQLGVTTIIVKNAARSVLYQDGAQGGEVTVAPATNVIDTTAAGDSFNAGVLAGILRRQDLAKGIAQGCALARQVIGQRGALVPVVTDRVPGAGAGAA